MTTAATNHYAHCIEASKKVRWEIEEDIFRGRTLDVSQKYLPDSMTQADRIEFLTVPERLLMSQIQGRTYANMFGLVERFINCKVLEIARDYGTGDQIALEALVRFSDEELKHQELFRQVEMMAAAAMVDGYRFQPNPNDVAGAVLSKCTWAVLGLTFLIELFTQSHYKRSIEPEENVSPLFKDIFLFHWKEESQHANLDELEWIREDAKLSPEQRNSAVDDMIQLVGAVDGLLQVQAVADADYLMRASGSSFYEENASRVRGTFLRAYRWQYIVSGIEEARFQRTLASFTTDEQRERIGRALAPIMP